MPGDRRIDACIDHFALMGYDGRDVRAVARDLLKVYGGGTHAWRFLEEGCYQVVQDRLLEIEDEEKQKQDQQVPDCVLQTRAIKIGTRARFQALIQWSGMPSALATWEDMETLRQRFPHAPALATWGGDASSSTAQSPSCDNNEHDIAQATTPHGVAQSTGAEHGPRRGTRVHRPSTWVKGSEWA